MRPIPYSFGVKVFNFPGFRNLVSDAEHRIGVVRDISRFCGRSVQILERDVVRVCSDDIQPEQVPCPCCIGVICRVQFFDLTLAQKTGFPAVHQSGKVGGVVFICRKPDPVDLVWRNGARIILPVCSITPLPDPPQESWLSGTPLAVDRCSGSGMAQILRESAS